MTTDLLFGVPPEVAQAMQCTMIHKDYLRVGIALMTRLQKENIDDYNSNEFKYRAKSISNYEKWIKEPSGEAKTN